MINSNNKEAKFTLKKLREFSKQRAIYEKNVLGKRIISIKQL